METPVEDAELFFRAQRQAAGLVESIGTGSRMRPFDFPEPTTRSRHSRHSLRSNRGRSRRVGVGDISVASAFSRTDSVGDRIQQQLEEYIGLRVVRVVDSEAPAFFVLQRLLSRQYHIGPEGAVIGSSLECSIVLPREAKLEERHFCITWNAELTPDSQYCANGSGYFSVEICKEGSFVITNGTANCDHVGACDSCAFLPDPEGLVPAKKMYSLTHGICFTAGNLEWCISALPKRQLLAVKMFDAVKKGNLQKLKSTLETSMVDPAAKPGAHLCSSESGVGVNIEYELDCYANEYPLNETQRTSIFPPLSQSSTSEQVAKQPSTLLHIAIKNEDLSMMKFLLEKRANVNHRVGEELESSLHLAARMNANQVMMQLLKYGGDVELMNAQHLTALALTTCYRTRKLLLNSMLLCAAAEAGDFSEVDKLINSTSVDANACALRHKSALHLAAARGCVEIVTFLLSVGANVNLKGGSRMRTALHYASLNNRVSVARVLLDAGADELTSDVDGYTPLNLCLGGDMCVLLHKQPLSLCLAVQSGDALSVEQLLNSVSEQRIVDQRNEQSHAPLHLACAVGTLAIVKLLVSHGADANIHGGSDSWSPLFYASMAGHVKVVEFLLAVGADLQAVDRSGKTVQQCVEQALKGIEESMLHEDPSESAVVKPLFLDVPSGMSRQESFTSIEEQKAMARDRYDRLRTISDLLLSGPDRMLKAIEAKNLKGFRYILQSGVADASTVIDRQCPSTALVRVCEDGLFQFAEVLLSFKPNVNSDGASSDIPLHVAAANGHPEIIRLLLQAGADVNKQSSDALTTALHEAASGNHMQCVQELLAFGANMSANNIAGETAFDCTSTLELRKLLACGPNKLMVAADTGEHMMIKQLIEMQKIDPDHEFRGGFTALHRASEAGYVESVRELLTHGADSNKQTHDGQLSPLHLASMGNHLEVTEMLLAAGARLDSKNSQRKVPFEVAQTNQMRKLLVRTVHSEVFSSQVGSSERCCMICMDHPINTIVLPCGHQAFCTGCVSRIDSCALDRIHIREVIRIYK